MAERFQTIIFLIRHGQTDVLPQIDRNHDGQRHLSVEGKAQAKMIGKYLAAFAPTAIYSSPFKRTLETAVIIQEAAEIPGEIIARNELAEVYTQAEFAARPDTERNIIQELAQSHAGQQIVLVSHQLPIEETLKRLGFTPDEIERPCQMGQGYRLVFASSKPVECQKINPAGV